MYLVTGKRLMRRPRSAPSFLKKVASECGRHSWPSSEAFTWERPCRAGRFWPSFKPLLRRPCVAKPMLERAVRLDSIASGTCQALGCSRLCGSILINGDLARLPGARCATPPPRGTGICQTPCRSRVRPFVVIVKAGQRNPPEGRLQEKICRNIW